LGPIESHGSSSPPARAAGFPNAIFRKKSPGGVPPGLRHIRKPKSEDPSPKT
jgi:hypothetical protein